MNVLINPGHALYGNPDPGAVNYEVDVTESELAYAIGTKTADYLEKAGCETRVMQSHNLAGEAPEYPEVIGTANAWGADLFVSIHCNAGGGRGAETFCYDRYSSAVPCAKFIQNQLSASFPDDPGFRNRGVKYSPGLCVLRLTEMPAVMRFCMAGILRPNSFSVPSSAASRHAPFTYRFCPAKTRRPVHSFLRSPSGN